MKNYVVAEAMKLGFRNGHPDWCNLGQGQPEVGELEGAPARRDAVSIAPGDHADGPVDGVPELRQRCYSIGARTALGFDGQISVWRAGAMHPHCR